MQAASATLTAAIRSKDRAPVFRLKVDWNNDGSFSFDPGVFSDTFSDTFESAGDIGDLTGYVESWSVDRSLSTDLPAAAKVNAGYGAAEARFTLAGTLPSGIGIVTALSAATGGASAWRRISAPVTIDAGFVGTAGPEYLRQFTGRIRGLSADPAAGAVNVTAIDGREKLRTPVSLSVATGQDAGFFMDEIATASGVTIVRDNSLNTGVATPLTDATDAWETLQQIAAAEQGVVLFDENDQLRFYNRDRMSGGSAVAVLTTDPAVDFANIKARAAEETVDGVRNYVTVTASPLTLDAAGSQIWSLGELVGVPGGSSTNLLVQFEAALHSTSAFSYGACSTSDGTGSNVTNLVIGFTATSATTATVSIYNPNAFSVWLVYSTTNPGTGVGNPALAILGRLLRPATDGNYTAIGQDSGSQAMYGRQPLDVGANPWSQSFASALALAQYLSVTLGRPHPTLTGLEIVGDPRLQLTDRVRVSDMDGLALDDDYWLVGISTRFSVSDGYAQAATLREAA